MVAVAVYSTQRRLGSFYVWVAVVCAVVAFGGFAPTYWLQLPAHTFVGPALLHVHAALFSAWILLLVSQTVLAARGQLEHHRAWGLVGVALASAMVVVGTTAAVYSLRVGLAAGYGVRSLAFFILPVSAILLFAGFFIAAIANIARPDTHKRLVLLATFALLQAAMARVFFTLITGGGPGLRPGLGPPPPLAIGVAPSLILEILIVAGMVYDWRTRGRPHPVWYVGAAVTAAVILLRGPLSATPGWLAFAGAMAHIAG